VISATTGLEFEIRGNSLNVDVFRVYSKSGSQTFPRGKSRKSRRANFLIRTSIPTSSGRDLEFYIFPEDLPEDLRKALNTERKKAIEELRRTYQESLTAPEK